MSYTTFSGTGDNLVKIDEWRDLQQKLPNELKLTSTIMMTSLSSALAQAARQNDAQVKQNLSRYKQEYPKLAAKRSNAAVSRILGVFDEMHAQVQNLTGKHLSRSAGEQRQYAEGSVGVERAMTGRGATEADTAEIEAQAQRVIDRENRFKRLVLVAGGLVVVGAVAIYLLNKG